MWPCWAAWRMSASSCLHGDKPVMSVGLLPSTCQLLVWGGGTANQLCSTAVPGWWTGRTCYYFDNHSGTSVIRLLLAEVSWPRLLYGHCSLTTLYTSLGLEMCPILSQFSVVLSVIWLCKHGRNCICVYSPYTLVIIQSHPDPVNSLPLHSSGVISAWRKTMKHTIFNSPTSAGYPNWHLFCLCIKRTVIFWHIGRWLKLYAFNDSTEWLYAQNCESWDQNGMIRSHQGVSNVV